MHVNIPLLTDSYKLTHHDMYPDGLEVVYSYYQAREGSLFPYTLVNGLQDFLMMLATPVTKEDVDYAENFADAHLGPGNFNREMWDIIVNEHGGKLPLRIKSVKEGTVVPTDNVLMTVENTDERCAPLTNHVETILCQLWHACNVGTISFMARQTLRKALRETGCDEDGVDFMLHDFGYRGVSSIEAAGRGGAAHLISFQGTDTLAAIEHIRRVYGPADIMPAFSVPATEHSVMTAEGRAGEFDVVQRLLDRYPTGILSVVSDSYDIYDACRQYGTRFKDQIMGREGKFVVRPDSGDPIKVTLKCLDILGGGFGTETNEAGYKVLPEQVGMLWGDGIDVEDMKAILDAMKDEGWAASNIVFGMGGGLLQKHNRDTQRFAFKCSANKVNGEWRPIFKDPVEGGKTSKKGRLKLSRIGPAFSTISSEDHPELYDTVCDSLRTVFLNGEITEYQDFNNVRATARQCERQMEEDFQFAG